MLESLSNNVAGSHDCYKTYLLHALLQFYFSLGKTLQSYVRRGIFRTKSKIYERAFFTSVKPYFKNVLNSIELPLGSMVYTTHTFVKKLTAENFGRKSLVNNGTIFSEIRNYAMEWRHHKKMKKGF